ncbi:RsmB/NOP family class I SAM-dependent RNA methyltransferase [Marimonas lutisalis]|uniref:RsmB/NOP family class I SAM-dependent RNA methyltransferase n=1 Tax=Marimonas lutisalis TaxID=2545756 RepID=UPI0010F8DD82|nr:RsmB/NOP family class I SAM-dependent RNA methyltransferase [Marimonas lutisalis]
MTPGARVQAAIECLEAILAGEPAERGLTRWARQSRFAGSKDRAAVRDHVYAVLRRKRACAAAGGGESGRALMLGLMRLEGDDPAALFNGQGHAPAPLSDAETAMIAAPLPALPEPELPSWLVPRLEAQYGVDLPEQLAALTQRAPVFLRVNLRKCNPEQARAALAREGVVTQPELGARTALRITEGERMLVRTQAYAQGLVELQDVSSQAAMETLPLRDGMRILDYCAGGGGKTLAMAGLVQAQFAAHDAAPGRMRDLRERAARAGVAVDILSGAECARATPFDLVLCDVPCSGSGTWRRDPDAKWRFTPERLAELNATQDEILDTAAGFVAGGGVLVYATCSILREENTDQIEAFTARHPDWEIAFQRQWRLSAAGDGFFVGHLTRAAGL